MLDSFDVNEILGKEKLTEVNLNFLWEEDRKSNLAGKKKWRLKDDVPQGALR